ENTGGSYFNDSHRIDILWPPLQPVQGGKKGNERGNPYVDVKEVLAIWRESAPEKARKKWLNIDPTEEDRVVLNEEADSDQAEETAAVASDEAESDAEVAETTDEDSSDATPRTAAADGDTETE
ncbi:MAG: hypothetical protein MI757_23175, partial [Pirellulales bacterium]|nr:hypothetical protein [Pirellulales bacterium]